MPPDLQKRRGPHLQPRGTTVLLVVLVVMLFAAPLAYLVATRTFHPVAPITLTAQPQPTSVHIVRIPGATPLTPLVPLDRTITGMSQVSQVLHLYQTVLHLPGTLLGDACAADPEVYVLTFSRSSQVLLTMQAHTGLCGEVILDRGNPDDTGAFRYRRTTPAFWSELTHLLGLPLSAVEPIPRLPAAAGEERRPLSPGNLDGAG